MNYKGVIFDLDGTLVNSLTDLANSKTVEELLVILEELGCNNG